MSTRPTRPRHSRPRPICPARKNALRSSRPGFPRITPRRAPRLAGEKPARHATQRSLPTPHQSRRADSRGRRRSRQTRSRTTLLTRDSCSIGNCASFARSVMFAHAKRPAPSAPSYRVRSANSCALNAHASASWRRATTTTNGASARAKQSRSKPSRCSALPRRSKRRARWSRDCPAKTGAVPKRLCRRCARAVAAGDVRRRAGARVAFLSRKDLRAAKTPVTFP